MLATAPTTAATAAGRKVSRNRARRRRCVRSPRSGGWRVLTSRAGTDHAHARDHEQGQGEGGERDRDADARPARRGLPAPREFGVGERAVVPVDGDPAAFQCRRRPAAGSPGASHDLVADSRAVGVRHPSGDLEGPPVRRRRAPAGASVPCRRPGAPGTRRTARSRSPVLHPGERSVTVPRPMIAGSGSGASRGAMLGVPCPARVDPRDAQSGTSSARARRIGRPLRQGAVLPMRFAPPLRSEPAVVHGLQRVPVPTAMRVTVTPRPYAAPSTEWLSSPRDTRRHPSSHGTASPVLVRVPSRGCAEVDASPGVPGLHHRDHVDVVRVGGRVGLGGLAVRGAHVRERDGEPVAGEPQGRPPVGRRARAARSKRSRRPTTTATH